jgi:hypothetical protein
MTKVWRIVVAALVLSVLVAGLSGCKKKEGPAERAGKEIDKAAEKTGQGIGNVVNKAGEKMEQAGDKIKDAVKK